MRDSDVEFSNAKKQLQAKLLVQVFIKRAIHDRFFHQKGLVHRKDAFSGGVVSGLGADQQFWKIHRLSSNFFDSLDRAVINRGYSFVAHLKFVGQLCK